jgi:glucose-6-phosphate dehydrogenase assembly protein OpcA
VLPVLLDDLGGIESELDRLWQANAAGTSGERAVLRAATYNLIALVPTESDGQTAASVFAELMSAHPGRVLVLCADPTRRDERIQAWVTLHCRAMGGGSQICGEQVVIVATGGAADRVAGALAALLVPDCPVVAWWRGGPGSALPLLDRLRASLDAVLFDGARVEPAALSRWVARLAGPGRAVTVGDLAWERTRGWRGWTAELFEAREARALLGGLRQVRVTHGPDGATAALLYVAWLAARLDWPTTPALARRESAGWAGRLGGVDVLVEPGGAAGAMTAIVLAADGFRGRLGREDGERVALTVERGGEGVERRLIRHAEPDDATAVGRWLERPGRDPVYADTLAALARLTGAA